jgi:menaquinone-dependent protoporphyrinogen oxidase
MTASMPGIGRILVAYSSKMGSTAEIAEAIGEELRKYGAEVDVSDAGTAGPPFEYDAIVLGSAVYAARWLKPARRYLKQNRKQMAHRPTWLFQSGPCGPGAQTQRTEPTPKIAAIAREIGVDPPVVFGGNLDPARAKGRIAKWVANSDAAGDYRDWDQIRGWAASIGERLAAASRGSSQPEK